MVNLNGLIEILERIDGLLENLDYGDAAHILDCFGVHFFERLHVAFHELGSFFAQGPENKDGVDNRNERS